MVKVYNACSYDEVSINLDCVCIYIQESLYNFYNQDIFVEIKMQFVQQYNSHSGYIQGPLSMDPFTYFA